LPGRHRSATVSRTQRVFRAGLATFAVLLALALGARAWVLAGSERAAACEGRFGLTIHAEPAVAKVLQAAANRLRARKANVAGTCLDVTVLEREPARVAAHLTVAAVGDANPDDLPDVWVPDSSVWLDLVRSRPETRAEVPPASVSVASSPVVVAMTAPAAATFGVGSGSAPPVQSQERPGDPQVPRPGIGWGRLLDAMSGRDPIVFGMPDPVSSATGVAALYALYEVLEQRKSGSAALTATCRALGVNAARTVSELMSRVPAMPSAKGVQAFPADEAAVWRFNREDPAVPLVAIYPAEGTMRLDYPYTVLRRAATHPGTSEAAALVLAEVVSPSGDEALFAAGLRRPDGTPAPQSSAVRGVSWRASQTLERPARAEILKLIRYWTVANLNARSLVLIDVSGSMAQEVPSTGATRMDLMIKAAQQGLGLFEDDNMLGLWRFSTRLSGDRDYEELVPVGTLSDRLGKGTRRSQLSASVDLLRPRPGGGTGLYDTIRAAHRFMRTTYDATKVNSVIVLTDGANDDPGSVSVEKLVADLRAGTDRRRPVPVFIIAFGPEIDPSPLRQIAEATSGAAYVTKDPRQITDVFFDAISKRICRPNC
jgi:Bacterial extracellular solute-binding protein/von Willebrand factor type A domain